MTMDMLLNIFSNNSY